MTHSNAFPSTSKLPAPITSLVESSKAILIKQGAEAKVYKTILYPAPAVYTPPSAASDASATSSSSSFTPTSSYVAPIPVLLKYRFQKKYRHATLDALLTRQRLTSEARALVRCKKAGVTVPGLRVVDMKQGVLGIEYIEGWSVREVLGGGQDDDEGAWDEEEAEASSDEEDDGEEIDIQEDLLKLGVEEDALLLAIGSEIAKMHLADVVHGDLTTSNMMVRLLPRTADGTETSPSKSLQDDGVFEVVLIDFGLSFTSVMIEDRAVDLYVLERAFTSTHPVPRFPSGEEGIPHFVRVLEGYAATFSQRGKSAEWVRIEKRLEDVRGRGRKRSMVG